MKIKIFNWLGDFKEVEIPNDIELIRVTVLSGDEVIEIFRMDKMWDSLYKCGEYQCYPEGSRKRNFFDCTYVVKWDEIAYWNNRPVFSRHDETIVKYYQQFSAFFYQ